VQPKRLLIQNITISSCSLAAPSVERFETYNDGEREVDALAQFEENCGWEIVPDLL
jgi:hypothetical protein